MTNKPSSSGAAPDGDEPLVLGGGLDPAPPPTAQEKWMAKYVQHMVDLGIHPDDAWMLCEGKVADHDYASDPVEAADEDMSYWDDDGDPG